MNFVAVAMMAAVGILAEFDGLPPKEVAKENHELAVKYFDDLQKYAKLDQVRFGPLLLEQHRLVEWWDHALGARQHYYYSLNERWRYARYAREIHDWTLYGWPPVWAYWRLPVYQGR